MLNTFMILCMRLTCIPKLSFRSKYSSKTTTGNDLSGRTLQTRLCRLTNQARSREFQYTKNNKCRIYKTNVREIVIIYYIVYLIGKWYTHINKM